MIGLLLTAGIFLISGILIRFCKCYWLISGYNTMSREKKQNVDIVGLGRLMGHYCLMMAGFFILAGLFARWEKTVFMALILGIAAAVTVFLLIRAQKYDRNAQNPDGSLKTGPKIVLILIIGTFIFIGFMLYFNSLPSEVVTHPEYLEIKGLYGMKVNYKDILGITLSNTIPQVIMKTNGFNLGDSLKGNFKLKGVGSARLFVNRNIPPFICIATRKSYIIVNDKEKPKTVKIFDSLRGAWKKHRKGL
jgi:hypothetical protein